MTASPTNPAETAGPLLADSVELRLAKPEDDAWIEDLQARCFGPGRFARAAFRVRERFPIDPTLSLVAEIGGEPVSSVWMTPISLSGVDGYLLGPLATEPSHRGKGAARKLVLEVTRLALNRDEGRFVLLVGDPPYYGPLGFVKTTPGAIVFPGPVDPERILVYCDDAELAASLHGEIAAFGGQQS